MTPRLTRAEFIDAYVQGYEQRAREEREERGEPVEPLPDNVIDISGWLAARHQKAPR